MPAAPGEKEQFIRALIGGHAMPDTVPTWADGTTASPEELREIGGLIDWLLRNYKRTRRRKTQRRAMRLLRSLLSAEQSLSLRQGGDFLLTGSRGGVYRLRPSMGSAWRVERHGKHWFAVAHYCIHSDDLLAPPADDTISHLLMLLSDEAEFLRIANHFERPPQCWDSAYMTERARIRARIRAMETRQ